MLKKELISLVDNAYELLNTNLKSEFYQNKRDFLFNKK